MGKTPAELEREIAAHRVQMTSKVRALDERVRSDIEDAKSTLQDDVKERTHINEYVEKRPFTTLLGAFGTGLLLGIATDGGGGGDSSNDKRRSSQQAAGGGLLGGLLGSASGLVGGPVQDEIRKMMRDVLGDQPKSNERRRTETPYQPSMGVQDFSKREDGNGQKEHGLDNMREHATRNGG